MYDHLPEILDAHYSVGAAGTHFTTRHFTFTPEIELALLRDKCERQFDFYLISSI